MKINVQSILSWLLAAFVFSCVPASNEGPNSLSGYSIHWKYTVKPESIKTFELEYGPDGTWQRLFRQSKHYKGSFLQRSHSDKETYLLIDTWTTKESYEAFKEQYREEYQKLSTRFEPLYSTEENLGTFDSVE